MADNDELAARLAEIDQEIGEARRRLSTLRHEGERHFIDDQPVDPSFTEALQGPVEEHDRLHPHEEEHAQTFAGEADQLAALEARIAQVRAASRDPHRDEQHFID